MAGWRNSFTEHFFFDKDDDGSEKASASEDIYQGITSGGKHGLYYQCNHILIFFRVLFFFRGELSLSQSPLYSEERERALWGVYPTGDFMNSAPTQHMPGWSWTERGACGSPRRMRIVRRPLENSRDWICRLSAKPEPASSHFLSWGERIKG